MDVVVDVHEYFAFFVPLFSYIVSTEGTLPVSGPGKTVRLVLTFH